MKKIKARKEMLDRICGRVHYMTTQMIWLANNREDAAKGDPKIGGHPAACASSLHITGALHLLVKTGFDYIANKPHAAPVDHTYNYMLDLFLKNGLERFSADEADAIMHNLRKFPQNGEPVFQSYHSHYDPDHHGFLPSGTVGIPPVNAGYLALAYRFAKEHGYDVPDAHFWSILGDSEFREGSCYEAIPDFAERELGNLTWIIDYNRQSLDGHRITNKKVMNGTDADRIERTMIANGWEVIQVRHGHRRLKLFERPDGEVFRNWLEKDLEDYELQALLLINDMAALRKGLQKTHPKIKKFLDSVNDSELYWAMRDMGGHDIIALADAMMKSKESKSRPTMIIAHTVKGWGLRNAASQGNHSSLPTQDEIDALREAQELPADKLFSRFDPKAEESKFLKERGDELYNQIKQQHQLKDKNLKAFSKRVQENGEIPTSFGINLKMASYPHTQWMLGQCTAKLTRIANATEGKNEKTLPPDEKAWKVPAELMVSMAPDVGTSTNLNPAMDGKIFGVAVVPDYETDFGVKDKKAPDLIPGEEKSDRFIRFDIAEGNVMSCMGSYGKMRDYVGVPIIPLMTVYDFFIKRAHDQLFYDLYWKSSFILVGTPSGVTLSPEGAQHGWKSDIQIPNQITWEPFFCLELDWIMAESIRRHVLLENEGRTGVLIRGVTRGVEQKMFAQWLKRQARFKQDWNGQALHPAGLTIEGAVDEASVASVSEEQIFEQVRQEVLQGGYYLIDYRGYAGYEPGDNVVNIFAMGALGTEAIKASEALLQKGIYANVIMVTSTDLLLGNQAHESDYHYLKNDLGIDGSLHLQPVPNGGAHPADVATLSGRRIPVVSVHDGEPGLLDNIGSIVGVKHESLAVRKHSKSGRPEEIYAYHHLDSASIVEAVGKVLSETALEQVKVSPRILAQVQAMGENAQDQAWRQLWPDESGYTGDRH